MENEVFLIIDQTVVFKMSEKYEGTTIVPFYRRPQFIHANEKKALSELTRLSEKFPDKSFLLYEAKMWSESGTLKDINDFEPNVIKNKANKKKKKSNPEPVKKEKKTELEFSERI